jgi:AcrR family transcriptional regulator
MDRRERGLERQERRNRVVLDAACSDALDMGLALVTRDGVARRAGVSAGSVTRSFGDMAGLRRAVILEAIARPMLSVLAEAIVAGDSTARDAPDDLRAAALASVAH